MARTGNSSLWISRNQSSVLRGANCSAPRHGFANTETRNLPFGERLLPGGDSRRSKRGHDYGIHTTRRPDDGNPIRLPRPRNPYVLDARRKIHWTAARRFAEQEVGVAGNFWNFGRYAANRRRDENRPSAGKAGF